MYIWIAKSLQEYLQSSTEKSPKIVNKEKVVKYGIREKDKNGIQRECVKLIEETLLHELFCEVAN